METASPPKKVSKKARASVGLENASATKDTEKPHENGEKEVAHEVNSTENNKEHVAENDVKKEETSDSDKKDETDKVNDKPQGKKRKHDETKDESNANDEDSNNAFLGFTSNEQDSTDEKDKNLPSIPDPVPPGEAFGKGKRSRIPNKRYESLGIKTFGKSFIPVGADHEVSSSMDTTPTSTPEEVSIKEEIPTESPSVKLSQRSRGGSTASPGTPAAKKQKMQVDLSNPAYLRPFEFGWKRELVWRMTYDSNQRRNSDIYYYAPNGKKVRSMREVAENLTNTELTLDDFTFFKEPLGINDPEKEIIRDAKIKGSGTPGGTPTAKKSTPKTPKTPKEKKEKVSTPLAGTDESPSKAAKSPRIAGGFKVKVPGSRLNQSGGSAKKAKRNQRTTGESMELGMLPPTWSPKKDEKRQTKSPKKKEPKEVVESTTTPTKSTRSAATRASKTSTSSASSATTTTPIKMDVEGFFMQNYLQNLSYGYQTLLNVFQYLKVQDLLRAGCVCTLWRDIASHPSLWKTVRMKNSQVANWEGFADALKKHNTQFLDLRKMLLPNNSDEVWPLFSKAIARVDTLVKIELCRCPATVVEELAKSNKNLQVINAVTIKCEKLDLSPIENLENLQELRLKSTNGFSLTSDLTPLKKLIHLKHLSLTSIKDLHKLNVNVIGDLTNLESLDLGECSDFPDNFGSDIISKLTKLEKLRLEKGQGSCCTFNILEAVSKIPTLEQLELVNFDVKSGFDQALGACTNVKKLLIIPTYISQSATTNHMVLGGIIKLKNTLSHFVWGVTLELLRVTELFVDQCKDAPGKEKKKPTGNGDSIPVLKPVPIMKPDDTKGGDASPGKDQPEVEILPLPTLQKLLLNCLPTTRVKILKIPFHATWRQSIVDTVN